MGKIQYFYTSHVGKCRRINQDNFCCNGHYMSHNNSGTDGILSGQADAADGPVFAIFDGMGGEQCGEMAAYLAAETMGSFTFGEDASEDLDTFCRQANNAICLYSRENKITSMGTTAAILRFTEDQAQLCNVGDSRIYLHSEGQLIQLSYDHVGISVAGRKPPLTQNLGIEETELIIEPYVAIGEYQPGNRFILCSDGLTDMVTEERIAQILEQDGQTAAQQLLQEALDGGGRDNVSFILIHIPPEDTPEEPPAKENWFKRAWKGFVGRIFG